MESKKDLFANQISVIKRLKPSLGNFGVKLIKLIAHKAKIDIIRLGYRGKYFNEIFTFLNTLTIHQ